MDGVCLSGRDVRCEMISIYITAFATFCLLNWRIAWPF